ncbi:MAG: NADH-quinone oxidoreductase subunit N [Candidatus Sumerlaeota bacterium]|nr:NADH-quinone oxidoreductase subunit N [Candidatus Sumerlaeota bacterium]
MSSADWIAISPLIAVAAAAVVVMMLAAFWRRHAIVAAASMIGLAVALFCVLPARSAAPRMVTGLLAIDEFGLFYVGLLLKGSLAVAAVSYGYLRARGRDAEEYYALLLTATLGCVTLAVSAHFVSFFLGLEILSVSLYALIAYTRERARSIEAGIKYLVLAAGSAAFLLFGMALLYAEYGAMGFAPLAKALKASGGANVYMLAGMALILVGAGFKLAAAPFHLWTPDVYEGAPAPATAFVAGVSKVAMAALLLRFLTQLGATDSRPILIALSALAVASMFAGNLLALLQRNVKRILAYSSIAHIGYLLVAFIAAGPMGAEAATFYLAAYMITTLIAFGVVAALSPRDRDADAMEDYQGLFWRRPWMGGAFVAALLSLAGIPLTAGFIGKYFVVASGIGSALWALVLILALNSAIGLFYYLRSVVAVYARPGEEAKAADRAPGFSLAGGVALAVLGFSLILLGVYPAPLLRLIQTAIASL